INHVMQAISSDTSLKFVVIIDEWDCILREFLQKEDWQKTYLDFLKFLFKDQEHLALVYMTGILPIKKYGTHSALNMFDEYSMLSASHFTEFVGFTEAEVKEICTQYKQNFAECKRWYDGYQIENFKSIYNPRSVNRYVTSGKLRTYWNNTETYEALQFYVRMKKYGLHDTIVELMAGAKVKINTSKFSNDIRTFKSKDDVLTLLVHLGYLSYNENDSTVNIPNKEIAIEFINAIEDGGWPIVVSAIKNSDELLQALLNKDSEKVALGLDSVHMLDNSILTYNNETALAHTISLAFYAARERYTIIREFPTGKGFADLVFLPKATV
ncbi:MAG: AAA family ATPase, partial [Desulfovibrio sp.]|nr:AAA family ATPase [Desulfovibrio sp.]